MSARLLTIKNNKRARGNLCSYHQISKVQPQSGRKKAGRWNGRVRSWCNMWCGQGLARALLLAAKTSSQRTGNKVFFLYFWATNTFGLQLSTILSVGISLQYRNLLKKDIVECRHDQVVFQYSSFTRTPHYSRLNFTYVEDQRNCFSMT